MHGIYYTERIYVTMAPVDRFVWNRQCLFSIGLVTNLRYLHVLGAVHQNETEAEWKTKGKTQ